MQCQHSLSPRHYLKLYISMQTTSDDDKVIFKYERAR